MERFGSACWQRQKFDLLVVGVQEAPKTNVAQLLQTASSPTHASWEGETAIDPAIIVWTKEFTTTSKRIKSGKSIGWRMWRFNWKKEKEPWLFV
ncbi:hypothetical protein HID58_073749 [Brassica napus]|uniref:Uncharacterized protein n=1 Tax=Brassica napus TaxID=3708 RepID=A0ABQ7XEL6_BRANA|nr:hypothetical protein HID58_073749 [Brassica napus]